MMERRRSQLGALLVLFLASVDAQSFLDGGLNTNTVADPYAQLPNCKDHGIFQGRTLEESCTEYCGANATESFDYADSNEDMRYVIRNTVCRCFAGIGKPDAQTNKTFECWSKAQVWDKQTPIMKCTDTALNITSNRDCEEFCSEIDPIAYGFTGHAGKAKCSCHDVLVCDDIGAATGVTIATSFVLLLGTVVMLW
jgi:hypothetical protein